MANRVILGQKGSNFGLFVSKPGKNVVTSTNIKDLAFNTGTSSVKGNFLMQKNINENNPASNTVTATITSDSTSVTSNTGSAIFVATGGDSIGVGTSSTGTGAVTISKDNTFTNRGVTYVKTSNNFQVTALNNFFV